MGSFIEESQEVDRLVHCAHGRKPMLRHNGVFWNLYSTMSVPSNEEDSRDFICTTWHATGYDVLIIPFEEYTMTVTELGAVAADKHFYWAVYLHR